MYTEAVYRLPPLKRSVFLLHRVDELGYDEIGRQLKIPVAEVQNCLRDTLLAIDAALDAMLPTCLEHELIIGAGTTLSKRHWCCRASCIRRSHNYS
ncbi:hypothetical protein BES08_11760 [Novosphingobium resinovorum]|uniref:RNA polymerase sigma factor 70 region 4 type 2 domain-containing protein n=1 Tax=Novosphingobium resinovorum TaxID=158500 RepID=A0A1D8A5G4_9SPHN|nr:hypothetical protein BES08_11760 [Novosphingobium resinovorum]